MREDYSSAGYWERRYVTGDREGHEWYLDYATLGPLLEILLPEPPLGPQAQWSVLEIGCGDRPLAPDLAGDEHFAGARVFAVDYSSAVVRSMRRREREERAAAAAAAAAAGAGVGNHDAAAEGGVSYEYQDARALTYGSSSFDLVLDKGTIDAMLCSDAAGYDNGRRICAEAARVLRPGGCFVVTSHMSPVGDAGQEFLSNALLPALAESGDARGDDASCSWAVHVHFQEGAEEEGPFVYAICKQARRDTRAARRRDTSSAVSLHLHSH